MRRCECEVECCGRRFGTRGSEVWFCLSLSLSLGAATLESLLLWLRGRASSWSIDIQRIRSRSFRLM